MNFIIKLFLLLSMSFAMQRIHAIEQDLLLLEQQLTALAHALTSPEEDITETPDIQSYMEEEKLKSSEQELFDNSIDQINQAFVNFTTFINSHKIPDATQLAVHLRTIKNSVDLFAENFADNPEAIDVIEKLKKDYAQLALLLPKYQKAPQDKAAIISQLNKIEQEIQKPTSGLKSLFISVMSTDDISKLIDEAEKLINKFMQDYNLISEDPEVRPFLKIVQDYRDEISRRKNKGQAIPANLLPVAQPVIARPAQPVNLPVAQPINPRPVAATINLPIAQPVEQKE